MKKFVGKDTIYVPTQASLKMGNTFVSYSLFLPNEKN